ncbi:nucleotide exchange factor GrpE [Lachnobacterium bovis]
MNKDIDLEKENVDVEVNEEVNENINEEVNEEVNETASEEVNEEAVEEKEESKKDKKAKKKSKKDEQIEDLTDRLKRQMAEFDNFRKRTEKEKSQMFDMGAKTILEKVLPIVDNFERGLSAISEEEKEGAFADGMEKVYKQLVTELDKVGVKPIECVGEEFDPAKHNAVMQVESDEVETGCVAQELLKGYTYKDEVLRHSMVAVAQ